MARLHLRDLGAGDAETAAAVARHRVNAWVFPSETGQTPPSRDNVWRRKIGLKLEETGLGLVDFHVTWRPRSALLNKIGEVPKLVADLAPR